MSMFTRIGAWAKRTWRSPRFRAVGGRLLALAGVLACSPLLAVVWHEAINGTEAEQMLIIWIAAMAVAVWRIGKRLRSIPKENNHVEKGKNTETKGGGRHGGRRQPKG